MTSARRALVGKWRISEMEQWDRTDFDMEVPAHLTIRADGGGEFQFILVQGEMDGRFTERDGRPAVEFSWDGHDEMDQTNGRGWALLGPDGQLTGRFFFHGGDDAGFTAKRIARREHVTAKRRSPRGRGPRNVRGR